MAELTDHTFFPSSAHPFCARPERAADELIETLEAALRRVTARPAGASPALVHLAHRALAALARIRSAGRLASISGHVAREFRLRPGDLQAGTRGQRVNFARQLAMSLCRKITGAPFESIGEHFNRDHRPLFTPAISSGGAWCMMPPSACSSRNWKARSPGRSPQQRRRRREGTLNKHDHLISQP